MLVARPSKRTGSELFATDMRFDILAADRPLGRLSMDRKSLGATFELEGETFTVEHTVGAEGEVLGASLVRVLTRRPKPPPGRNELKAADGRVLAVAEQAPGEVFQVTREGERFRFAKGRSRLSFDLCRDGEATPLGSVGQRKFWTTQMHMDLPDSLGAPFQVFLLTVLLALTLQRAATAPSL